MAEWRNWAGNVVATPARIERPGSIEAVQELIAGELDVSMCVPRFDGIAYVAA